MIQADEDDDDDIVALFREDTEKEKKSNKEDASVKKKESAKSRVLMDVNPWDDETDMKELENAVRSLHFHGLLWAKLVPVAYGITKLEIMIIIVDDLVSVDT